MKPVWSDKSIYLSSKIRLMRSLVASIFQYAFESWTLKAELQRRIQAIEMRCYRKILHISYLDRPGVWQVLEGGREQGQMEKTGCKIICCAPTTLAVKGLMMMMIMMMMMAVNSVSDFFTKLSSS